MNNTNEIKITMSNGALTYEISIQKFAINCNTKEWLLEEIKSKLDGIIGDEISEIYARTN